MDRSPNVECLPGAGGASHSASEAEPVTVKQRLAEAAKRLYDLFFAACGLLALSPFFLLLAILIKASDGGPVFYRQVRVGLRGRSFRILKFRTMVPGADLAGPPITREGDERITWLGGLLRAAKVDELPQLWNVLKGQMSLVGPRPEVPRYVQQYTSEQRQILRFKPGITDLASLCFRNEALLLRNAANVEDFYVRNCIPRKLRLNRQYALQANLVSDTWLILQTICPYWISMLAVYGGILVAAFWVSLQLLYDFALPDPLPHEFNRQLLAIVALQLGCLTWRKQCRGLLSYFSFPELRQSVAALGFAALLLVAIGWATNQDWPPPNVILLDFLLSLGFLSGFRLVLRRWREQSSAATEDRPGPPVRVAIVGAGTAGAQLARDLMRNRRLGRTVVAFFDDDSQKWDKLLHEVPIVGMPECLAEGWDHKLDEVFIALPDASTERIREIVRALRQTRLPIYSVPSPAVFWCRQDD